MDVGNILDYKNKESAKYSYHVLELGWTQEMKGYKGVEDLSLLSGTYSLARKRK